MSGQPLPNRVTSELIVTREEPALRQRLIQVEFRELWRPKPRIWSMNEWEVNASSQSAGQFCGGCFCIGHLYAQGLWHWEGPSTHSTRFVVSKQRDFPGGASGFCPVALASELRRNVR